MAALTVETTIRDAVRAGLLDRAAGDMLVEQALEAGIITEEERGVSATEARGSNGPVEFR